MNLTNRIEKLESKMVGVKDSLPKFWTLVTVLSDDKGIVSPEKEKAAKYEGRKNYEAEHGCIPNDDEFGYLVVHLIKTKQ